MEADWPNGRSETLFLRLGEAPGERRDGEVRVHQLLRAGDLHVPEVVAWEGIPPELDRAATLTRAIPGFPLHAIALTASPGEIASIAAAAGRELASIGEIPVHGFGWIDMPDPTTGTLRAEHPTRRSWVAEYDRALETVIAIDRVSPASVPALRETFTAWREHSPDTSTGATLAHGDFDASHIFCTREEANACLGDDPCTFTGIIDFGEVRGADPFYDLGHALLHDGEDSTPAIFPALLGGYRTVRALDRDALNAIHSQAVAIGVRHLAIAHGRGSPYARVLASRIVHLLSVRLADDGTEIRS